MLFAQFGLLGGLAAAGTGNLGNPDDAIPAEGKSYSHSELSMLERPIKVRLKQLPTDVYKLTDWDFRRRNPLVVVVPKKSVVKVQYSFWTTCDLYTQDEVYKLDLSVLRRGRATLRGISGRWILSSNTVSAICLNDPGVTILHNKDEVEKSGSAVYYRGR